MKAGGFKDAICQIRLDFDHFQISEPTAGPGSCDGDTVTFTSPSGFSPPEYCGTMTGTHSKLLMSYLRFEKEICDVFSVH